MQAFSMEVVMLDAGTGVSSAKPRRIAVLSGGLVLLILAAGWLEEAFAVAAFVATSLIQVAPIVIPGILLAAWVVASDAGGHIASIFQGRLLITLVAAAGFGAVTPVCGITVLPLMAGLLAAGVPLAPIMAFWLSSPITDPAMLATTAATLGIGFAVGKTAAAFGLGLYGGLIVALLTDRSWVTAPLRSNRFVGDLGAAGAGSGCGADVDFDAAVWRTTARRSRFASETWATTRLILICLIPAFAAEYVLNALLQPGDLAAYVGADVWWAVPIAVLVGGPAYIDGYAALPLTRALIEHGMSKGAAMAFLVSGGVVSIWGAMAIFPVLKLRPFLLYLMLALSGSMAAGWLFELAATVPTFLETPSPHAADPYRYRTTDCALRSASAAWERARRGCPGCRYGETSTLGPSKSERSRTGCRSRARSPAMICRCSSTRLPGG